MPEGELIQKINVESSVHGIDISPDNNYIYLSGGSRGSRGDLIIIETESKELVKRINTNGAGHVNFSLMANMLT